MARSAPLVLVLLIEPFGQKTFSCSDCFLGTLATAFVARNLSPTASDDVRKNGLQTGKQKNKEVFMSLFRFSAAFHVGFSLGLSGTVKGSENGLVPDGRTVLIRQFSV